MRLFTCTDHDLHYPVGCASIVIADNEAHAIELLDAALIGKGLKPFSQEPYTLIEIDLSKPQAVILRDGDY